MNKTASLSRSITWIGDIDSEPYQKIIEKISGLIESNTNQPINLLITSGGGSLEIAYSFHDLVTSVLKPKLNTLAA